MLLWIPLTQGNVFPEVRYQSKEISYHRVYKKTAILSGWKNNINNLKIFTSENVRHCACVAASDLDEVHIGNVFVELPFLIITVE